MKMKKVLSALLIAALVITMVSAGSLTSFASAEDRLPAWAADNSRDAQIASTSANLPAKYELHDEGVVTPVKLQNPWGTCWSFGGVAAAEISILSSLGLSYEETGLDISEKHLAYFARRGITENEDPAQAGEGSYMLGTGKNVEYAGGDFGLITTIFSQGVGPVTESMFPYRGKEATYLQNGCYSADDDWSIPETDEDGQSNRFISGGYVLKDGNVLPKYWNGDKSDFSIGATAIKQEIINGHGVAIKYYADQAGKFSLSDLSKRSVFYAQYGYEEMPVNHGVCIVGWDDNYDASNFAHSKDLNGNQLTDDAGEPISDEKAAQMTTPPGNGAWIVKNSWGSVKDAQRDDLGNITGFNIVGSTDENGAATGYFYLSYYDKTITDAETFEFSANLAGGGSFGVLQYDYMPSISDRFNLTQNDVMSSANIFPAEQDMQLKSISTSTGEANTRVTFAVYLLDDDAKSPTDGTMVTKLSRNFAYSGYHRVDLDNPLTFKKGQRLSIVSTASIVNNDGGRTYSVTANRGITEEFAREHSAGVYSVAVVNKGESFVYQNGQWTDWSDRLNDLLAEGKIDHDQCIDNFSIKAYVVPVGSQEETFIPGDADGDGSVTVLDATAIQRKLAGLPVENYNEKAADADGDGNVTVLDATAIQRCLAGLDSPLSKPEG